MTQRRPFNIGIETAFLNAAMTGVGNYCFHLLAALMEDNDDFRFSEFTALSWRPFGERDLHHYDRMHHKGIQATAATNSPRLQRLRQAVWAKTSQSDFARRIYRKVRTRQFVKGGALNTLDLFHAFKYLPLIDLDIPVLPVVYDLSFVRFPEMHPRERINELQRLPDVVRRAPFVHTISEFSKAEIADVYGYPPERIIVAPPAASARFRPLGLDITRADIAPLGLSPGHYLLAVGTLEPRKNLRTLIAAYAELPASLRERRPLVIAGGSGWGTIELPPAANRMVRDGSLRFLGSVSDAALRSLYEGARALLFPSLYEGFGMPAVEALACGTEVVHSSNTSMDEITEGASLTVAATDVPGWVAALKKLLDNPQQNEIERELRIAQSKKFNWQSSANTVKKIYHRISAGEN